MRSVAESVKAGKCAEKVSDPALRRRVRRQTTIISHAAESEVNDFRGGSCSQGKPVADADGHGGDRLARGGCTQR
jgi:hypothetical protein